QADAQKRNLVARFAKLHGQEENSIRTRADLIKLFAQVNDDVVRDVFLNHVHLAANIPIYFWIADCREAVFAIANPGDGIEQGFYTSDRSLIRSLLDVRKRYGTNVSLQTTCD
ncbi:MAG TPA: hypothetical protein VN181_06410, partial [Thermoanaerobaculia bacterium]|nr:hypothetical protein [Thermoanaerobaculia bacterium]